MSVTVCLHCPCVGAGGCMEGGGCVCGGAVSKTGAVPASSGASTLFWKYSFNHSRKKKKEILHKLHPQESLKEFSSLTFTYVWILY